MSELTAAVLVEGSMWSNSRLAFEPQSTHLLWSRRQTSWRTASVMGSLGREDTANLDVRLDARSVIPGIGIEAIQFLPAVDPDPVPGDERRHTAAGVPNVTISFAESAAGFPSSGSAH